MHICRYFVFGATQLRPALSQFGFRLCLFFKSFEVSLLPLQAQNQPFNAALQAGRSSLLLARS